MEITNLRITRLENTRLGIIMLLNYQVKEIFNKIPHVHRAEKVKIVEE